MAADVGTPPTAPAPAVIEEQLVCALTGKPVTHAEAYWAPPLVTARELVGAILTALFRAPGTLSTILFAEQPNVPYAPDARDLLAQRRSSEQLKLLGGLLVVAALIVLPIILLAMR
jgi:hypothetical protein